MNPRLPFFLFVAWCGIVLMAFAAANADGFSAFAASGRPTPFRTVGGQHHK
jgi:hypothetical protein